MQEIRRYSDLPLTFTQEIELPWGAKAVAAHCRGERDGRVLPMQDVLACSASGAILPESCRADFPNSGPQTFADGSQLFLVADGMGGMTGDGAFASSLAVTSFMERIGKFPKPSALGREEIRGVMREVNRIVCASPRCYDTGSTLCGALIYPQQGQDVLSAKLFSLGDSMGFVVQGTEVLLPYPLTDGSFTKEDPGPNEDIFYDKPFSVREFLYHPHANALYAYLGQLDTSRISVGLQYGEVLIPKGGHILLMSDGPFKGCIPPRSEAMAYRGQATEFSDFCDRLDYELQNVTMPLKGRLILAALLKRRLTKTGSFSFTPEAVKEMFFTDEQVVLARDNMSLYAI